MTHAICPTGPDDYLDAQARADPRTWGVRRDMPSPASPNRPDFELVKVTPAMREELGLAEYIGYIMRPKEKEGKDD